VFLCFRGRILDGSRCPKKNPSRHGKGGIISHYCAIPPSQPPFIAYNIAQYIFPMTPFIAMKNIGNMQYLVRAKLLPSSALELGGQNVVRRERERDPRRRGEVLDRPPGPGSCPTREPCARAPQQRRWTTCRGWLLSLESGTESGQIRGRGDPHKGPHKSGPPHRGPRSTVGAEGPTQEDDKISLPLRNT